MPRQILDNLPFRDLGIATMQALSEAGHEITIIAKWSPVEQRIIQRRAYFNRAALCFLTGRSPSSVDYWINTGKIKPARKHGSYTLFAIEDVNYLLQKSRFPTGNAAELFAAKTMKWLGPLSESFLEKEQQAEELAEVKPRGKKPGKSEQKDSRV